MKKSVILFLISLLTLILLSGCLTTYMQDNKKIPRNGLIFEMLFNGSILETSGSHIICTPLDFDFVADRFDSADNACAFNGDSSYVLIPDSEVFDFSNSSLTISAWTLFTNRHAGAIASYIMNFFCEGNSRHIEFYCNYPNEGELGAHLLTDPDDPNEYRVTSENPLINDGKWHHLVMQYDRENNSASLFIDGIKTASLYVKIEGRLNKWDKIGIGRSFNEYSFFEGSIDDVRIYNRVLSQTEIDQILHENGWRY